MAAVGHIRFSKFQILVAIWVGRASVHHCTKFPQSQSNGCKDIAFNSFQNKGHPLSWIFKNLNLWRAIMAKRASMHHQAKFRQNWPNSFGDITISSIFKMVAIGHLGFSKFQIFGSQSGWEGQCASSYQISSKSIKRLLHQGSPSQNLRGS